MIPESVMRELRYIEVETTRKIRNQRVGAYQSPLRGPGFDFDEHQPYRPGDDVRRIDWNVTARTAVPHVRVHVPERALTAWLLLDVSPSMTFGTADRRKADVAEGVAVAIGHLATQRGNRLGIVTFGGSRDRRIPPAAGRSGLLGLLLASRVESVEEGLGETSAARALRLANAAAARGGLVVLVTDFRGPRDWVQPLAALTARHHVLAIEIRDPREGELTDVGELTLVDAETGREVRVDTSSRRLRERFAEAAAIDRRSVARELRRIGVDHLVLSTRGDWLRALAAELHVRGIRA